MKRHTPLKRGGPILRRTRLRMVSKKMARKLAVYRVKMEKFLAEHKDCEIGPVLRAAGIMESNCEFSGYQVHHRARRIGANLTDETQFVSCCSNCHRFIETHAGTARKLGLITA